MNAASILEQLWADHHDEVYFYIAKRTSGDVAEDLTQDVYLRAYESLAAGRGYTSSPRGWLFRMAHNAVIDFYRYRDGPGNKAIRAAEELTTANEGSAVNAMPTAHELVESEMEQAALYQAISQLTDTQRQVVELHLDGWRQVDMCEPLQKTWEAIKQTRLRAFATLHRKLARDPLVSERMAA